MIAIICIPGAPSAAPKCEYAASIDRKDGRATTPVYDKELDLAMLYINWHYTDRSWKQLSDVPAARSVMSLPLVSVRSVQAMHVGDEVTTFGFPAYGRGTLTMSKGSIKDFTVVNGNEMIAIDAKIGHGSSGGAVFSKDGELLGIVTDGQFDSSGRFIQGYALPIAAFINWQKDKGIATATSNAAVTDAGNQPKKSPLAYSKLLQRTYLAAN
jgi:hypothetical protein